MEAFILMWENALHQNGIRHYCLSNMLRPQSNEHHKINSASVLTVSQSESTIQYLLS